jgi:signal transduction histidine kinase
VVIVSRDVTERRSLERQVVHAEKLHALGNLAAGLAHELNTPLGTILGYAQMLLDERPAGELRIIEEQARRCRKIVQGLLDFARKSSGERVVCDPNALATKVRELLSHSLRVRSVSFELDLADPPPPRVEVAADEIEQVLVNLVTNAADAIEMHAALPVLAAAGGGSIGREEKQRPLPRASPLGTVWLCTRTDAKGRAVLAVEDDGPGVPEDVREQIFEPFFTTKAAGRGTGLGLSIARRIVEDHGGELRLTERDGGLPGARFELRLPPRS